MKATSAIQASIDVEGKEEGGYSGTFRWKSSKKLPRLSTSTSSGAKNKSIVTSAQEGWMGYFKERYEDGNDCVSLIKAAKADMSLIDCLSFPLSILFALNQMKFNERLVTSKSNTTDTLHIVCIGCSAKAEERVLIETDTWQELFIAYEDGGKSGIDSSIKQLHLYLVGPEMTDTYDYNKRCHIHKATAKEFFRNNLFLLQSTCVVVGLNCGFGNFENPLPHRYDLLLEWLGDLYFLTGTKLPIIFTCANDYADLNGENQIMQKILGCNYILQPLENPYGFASTFISEIAPEGREDKENYSRGNSFLYAVQGNDRQRRRVLDLKAHHDDQVNQVIGTLEGIPMIPFAKLMQEVILPDTKKASSPSSSSSSSSSLSPSKPPSSSSSSSLPPSKPLIPPAADKSFEELLAQTSSINQSNAYLKPPSSFPSVQDILLSDSDSEDEDGNIKIYKPPPPLNFSAPIPDEIRQMYKDYDKKFEEAKAKWNTTDKKTCDTDEVTNIPSNNNNEKDDGNLKIKKGFLMNKNEDVSKSKVKKQSLSEYQSKLRIDSSPSSSSIGTVAEAKVETATTTTTTTTTTASVIRTPELPIRYEILNNGHFGITLNVENNDRSIVVKASEVDKKLFGILEVHASIDKIVISVGDGDISISTSTNSATNQGVIVHLQNLDYRLQKDEMTAKLSKKKGTLVIECPFVRNVLHHSLPPKE